MMGSVRSQTYWANNKNFPRTLESVYLFGINNYLNCCNVINVNWCLLQAEAVEHPAVIHVTGQNYRWLSELQSAITGNSQRHIVLVAQGEPLCGIVGLVNCIRREPRSDFIRLQLCYFNIFMAVKYITNYSEFTWSIQLHYQCNMYICIYSYMVVYNENIYTAMFDIRKRIYRCASKDWIHHLTSGGSYMYQLL
jgi:hypothetical protein